MNKIISKEMQFAGKKLILETGELAFMANMAVKATYGDTVVLVTAVSGGAVPDTDFFPLTVNYEEKLYASGLIKSSRFVKRDGKSTDEATITKRLIDHAIRPLFPKDYMDEVQVVVTVLSLDKESDVAFLSMIATSAALMASDIPWTGPMTSARVGYVDGAYVMNPSRDVFEEHSDLEMMVSFAGADRKFLAVEAGVNILPEEKILESINFARNEVTPLVSLINDFAKEVNPSGKKYEYVSKDLSEDMLREVSTVAHEKIEELIRQEFDKVELKTKMDTLKTEVLAAFEDKYSKVDIMRAIDELEKKAIQHLILEEGKRTDGRAIDQIRPLSAKVGILPRTHGSALFTRGVTQVLTVATLGSPSMELLIQDMYGESTKRYMHYYNFAPFASGETGRMGAPKSREIGHGMLAEKALKPVIPSQTEFPYTIMLVSETLSSSGSSSMASACGSTLALMDAGVPIKEMVAGIGVGLIVNDDLSKYKVVTDLAYLEDAFGFLDFKMTGTRTGVTAIQADMKLPGIPMDLMPEIIERSKQARMQVLDVMESVIRNPRENVSQYAPKTVSIKIDPSKIGTVIGSGGKTIKEIQEKTKSEIYIDDDGTVVISAISEADADKAKGIVDGLTRELHEGEVFEGKVVDLLDFGALVEILPGRVGLLHVSEVAYSYVENVRDVINIGDTVRVKIVNLGNDGKIGLSKKALEEKPEGYVERPRAPRRENDFKRRSR